MTAVANKLREARSLIERGWCQNSFASADNNRCCADGAFILAGGTDEARAAFMAAIDANRVPQIWTWNDAPERTQADVLAAFDRAISIAESGQ